MGEEEADEAHGDGGEGGGQEPDAGGVVGCYGGLVVGGWIGGGGDGGLTKGCGGDGGRAAGWPFGHGGLLEGDLLARSGN